MNLKSIFIELLNQGYISDENERNKKQVLVFLSVNFGLTFLLGLGTYFTNFISVEIYGHFMMILPASSVAIAKFYTEGKYGDRWKFHSIIILIFISCLILLIFKSTKIINDNQALSIIYILSITSSLYLLNYFLKDEEFYIFKNIRSALILIVYFIIVKIIFTLLLSIIEGEVLSYHGILTYIFTPVTSLLTIYFFWGEEYGWRGYLQCVFFKKFGKIRGVILVGLIWGLWHLLLNILLFETINIKATIIQMIHVVGLSIFFAYVYMKTENIFICSIIHALNNAAGVMNPNYNYSGEITYLQIGFTLIFISIFYIPFLFTKEYKKVKE